MTRPTVLVADDHTLVLERVLSLLRRNFEVVGAVRNGSDLVAEARRLQPDVIVLDITMPILNGIDAAKELHDVGSSARLVFLTVHGEAAFVRACFAEGANGYVTKSHMATDLVPAINEALCGHCFISNTLPTEGRFSAVSYLHTSSQNASARSNR